MSQYNVSNNSSRLQKHRENVPTVPHTLNLDTLKALYTQEKIAWYPLDIKKAGCILQQVCIF
jgi:hypothetical protein